MPKIQLTKGQFAIVDAQDLPLVTQYHWYAHESRPGVFYARGIVGGHLMYLHRFLMDAPAGQQVDHISRNTLDCRRQNLRLSRSQKVRGTNFGACLAKSAPNYLLHT
jgi:hypothetical protein